MDIYFWIKTFLAGIYFFKVNHGNSRSISEWSLLKVNNKDVCNKDVNNKDC